MIERRMFPLELEPEDRERLDKLAAEARLPRGEILRQLLRMAAVKHTIIVVQPSAGEVARA